MQWYKIHIPRNEIGGPKYWNIHRLYGDLFLAFPLVMQNTLLVSTRSNFDNYHYYFYSNPNNDVIVPVIINYFDGEPCEAPSKDAVGFIGGDTKLWIEL